MAAGLLHELTLATDELVRHGASDGTVFDSSQELKYFCTILEEVLRTGLRTKGSFFKQKSTGSDCWRYIEELGRRHAPARDMIVNINGLQIVTSNTGRVRTWIRRCLIEKTLGAHMAVLLVDNVAWTRENYEGDSLLCEPKTVEAVLALLRRLGQVDFDLKAKNVDLDESWEPKVFVWIEGAPLGGAAWMAPISLGGGGA